MNSKRFFQLILVLGTTLTIAATFLFFKQGPFSILSKHPVLIAQNVNEYLGPAGKNSDTGLIRVQLLINDDPNPKGVQIVKVTFDHKNLILKPRDIYGFRGQSSFQMAPGRYTLKWTVRRDKSAWPRTSSYEEEVTIDPRDLWLQITIIGEKASIS